MELEIVESLRAFHKKGSFQRTVMQVLAFNQKPADLEQLRMQFIKLDQNGQGEITLEELLNAIIKNDVKLVYKKVRNPTRRSEPPR